MDGFVLIMMSYFKRFFRDFKEVLLLIAIPVGLTVMWSLINAGETVNGYNVNASFNAVPLMLSFQFFNAGIMIVYLFHDFRGEMRWRLLSMPRSLMSFVLPAFVANWMFSVVLGILVLIVSAVFLNAYLGNLLILAAVLLLVSLMATFISMLIFLYSKKLGSANGKTYIVSFGLMILSGYMIPLGNSPIVEFFNNYGTPLSLGARAVMYSGTLMDYLPNVESRGMEQALINVGILAAATLVIGIITIIATRRRKV